MVPQPKYGHLEPLNGLLMCLSLFDGFGVFGGAGLDLFDTKTGLLLSSRPKNTLGLLDLVLLLGNMKHFGFKSPGMQGLRNWENWTCVKDGMNDGGTGFIPS